MKDLAELKALQKRLKERAAAAAEAERQRRELAAQREREANVFRDAIGKVTPLNAPPRVLPDPPRPEPIAQQRIADDEAVLRESLSDEFSIDTLLEVDETLSYARGGIGPDVLKKLRGGGWVVSGMGEWSVSGKSRAVWVSGTSWQSGKSKWPKPQGNRQDNRDWHETRRWISQGSL